MFKVSRGGKQTGGYTISTGDGRPVIVTTEDEVKVCLDHYFGNEPVHRAGKVSTVGCAFCKQIAARAYKQHRKNHPAECGVCADG